MGLWEKRIIKAGFDRLKLDPMEPLSLENLKDSVAFPPQPSKDLSFMRSYTFPQISASDESNGKRMISG